MHVCEREPLYSLPHHSAHMHAHTKHARNIHSHSLTHSLTDIHIHSQHALPSPVSLELFWRSLRIPGSRHRSVSPSPPTAIPPVPPSPTPPPPGGCDDFSLFFFHRSVRRPRRDALELGAERRQPEGGGRHRRCRHYVGFFCSTGVSGWLFSMIFHRGSDRERCPPPPSLASSPLEGQAWPRAPALCVFSSAGVSGVRACR